MDELDKKLFVELLESFVEHAKEMPDDIKAYVKVDIGFMRIPDGFMMKNVKTGFRTWEFKVFNKEWMK